MSSGGGVHVNRQYIREEMQIEGMSKSERIAFGMALFEHHAIPGQCYPRDELALWWGCSDACVMQMEQRALRSALRKLAARGLDKELAAALLTR